MTFTDEIRLPAVAGMFYPGGRDELSTTLRHLLTGAAVTHVEGTVVALVSPHAGYQYSGLTAAHGYNLLNNRTFDTVVIVAPSHREYFNGISVYHGRAYRTPFGEMQIAGDLREQLLSKEHIIESSGQGHGEEHAIEVQLPFLQAVVGNVDILPIVIGDQRREYCFHLGEKLGSILKGKNVLLVASTDLSHYYTYETAGELDKVAIDDVAAFDHEQLMTDLELERTEACGGGPIVTVLLAAKELGANHMHVLSHCNSGDITGDHRRVVGYLSAAASRTQ